MYLNFFGLMVLIQLAADQIQYWIFEHKNTHCEHNNKRVVTFFLDFRLS